MSGTYRHLRPGRYHLEVAAGRGPAGIRRPDGRGVMVGIDGGRRSFSLDHAERVYYWWRGPAPPDGVHLIDRMPQRLAPTRETASTTRPLAV